MMLAIVCAGLLSASGPAAAVTLCEHAGAADPTTESFTVYTEDEPNLTIGPVVGDMGYDAWNVNSQGASICNYQYLPPPEEEAMIAQGWTLSARIRMVDADDPVDGGVHWRIMDHESRFWIFGMGSTADGDPIIKDWQHSAITLDGLGNGYHLYELVNQDADGVAELFVDGTSYGDIAGTPYGSYAPRVEFGCPSGSETGNGNYNWIHLDAVPEPAALVVLALAAPALLRLRRKA
jgi:hypothetical protein